jgi:hypothetical protein
MLTPLMIGGGQPLLVDPCRVRKAHMLANSPMPNTPTLAFVVL